MKQMQRNPGHQRIWFAIALSGIAIGVCLFIYGQALGALLVSDCPEFSQQPLPTRCQRPRLYIDSGATIALVAILATGVLLYRRLLRGKSLR